jgi:hypothetical protein
MRFSMHGGGDALPSVTLGSEDDYFYFRDSVHDGLEQGEFGSRFSMFLGRFVPAEWAVNELEALQGELEAIAQAFRNLPPQPFDSHWSSRAAASGKAYGSLFDVYVDAAGQPLLLGLIELCRAARQQSRALTLR